MKRKINLCVKMLICFLSVSILFLSVSQDCLAVEQIETEENQEVGYIDATTLNTAYVFLGDSRFVGMEKYAQGLGLPNIYVIAKVAKGYNWLEQNALAELQQLKDSTDYDKYIVICNLGVNDLGNLNKYISILPRFYAEDTDLYWMSVNPTIDSLSTVKCGKIEEFNNTLKQYIPATNWIDTYTYLTLNGFKSRDGVHYDSDTYNMIFYYTMSYVLTVEFLKTFPMVIPDSQP